MKKLCLFLCVLLVFGALCGCSSESDTQTLRFPTAASTGALYPLGASITRLWNEKIDGISASSQASGGGVENLNLLYDGEAEVSIAISSNCYEAYTGTGTFEGRENENLRVIAGLYYNPNHVIVADSTNADSLTDLKGARFAVGAAGSSGEGEARNHFTAAGLAFPQDLKVEYVGFGDAVSLLQNRNLDGAWIMAGLNNAAVTEALTVADAHLLAMDDALIENLRTTMPWYVPYTIPAGTYPGQTEDVQTSAVKMILFCDASLDADLVYEMTKVFWENLGTLQESNVCLDGLTVSDAVTDLVGLPLHEGANRYYQEVSVMPYGQTR